MQKKEREYIAVCPGCLTWETVWFIGDTFEKVGKFNEGLDGKVYHDCKLTEKPCRLYPRFIERSLGVYHCSGPWL